MFLALARSPRSHCPSRLAPLSSGQRNYCHKEENVAHLGNLFVLQVQKLYSMRGGADTKVPEGLLHRIMAMTSEMHVFEQEINKITQVFNNSVGQSMATVMNRKPGSAKGIMYHSEYFKEVCPEGSYADHVWKVVHDEKWDVHKCFDTHKNDFCHFITKRDVSPSLAIGSFFEGPTVADCGSTIEAIYIKAILDVLGEEHFNASFRDELQIRKFVCPDLASALDPYLDFIDPRLLDETREDMLEIGDHVLVRGVPWYNIKHPLDHMQNMHGLVVGFNTEKEPLLGGLGFNSPLTPTQMKQALIDAYNQPQTKEDMEFINMAYGDAYLSPKFFSIRLEDHPQIKEASQIYREYTVPEIQALGGCKLINENSCRISPFVLAFLQSAPDRKNLKSDLALAKSLTLGKQFMSLMDHR